MDLVLRPLYLRQIEPFIDAPMVKVLTGLRRSGKSSIMSMIVESLLTRGIPRDRIVHLNFDDLELSHLANAVALNDHLASVLPSTGRVYVLLDEVQEIEQWERLVNSLLASGRVDVYITGSNSRLLSGELATYIAGRYVSFEVWPLSFAEYLDFVRDLSGREVIRLDEEFQIYLRRGGFPGVHAMPYTETEARRVVSDIYRSTIVRDVLTRNSVRDAEMFDRVATFAIDNVGNPFSARSVAAFLKSQQRSISHETVMNYLRYLADSFIIARVPRFDVRGRKLLATDEKHYLGDHGLSHALFGSSVTRLPGILENVVWLELRRRGYDVTVGRVGGLEVDIVASRQGEQVYIQVATTILASEATRQREYASLQAIADNHPKYVVTLDPVAGDSLDGIRHLTVPDFLLLDSF